MRFTLFYSTPPLHLHVLCIRDRCPWAERTWRWELKSEIWKNEGVCDLKTRSDVSQFTSVCDNTCRGAWSWGGGGFLQGCIYASGLWGPMCHILSGPPVVSPRPARVRWVIVLSVTRWSCAEILRCHFVWLSIDLSLISLTAKPIKNSFYQIQASINY